MARSKEEIEAEIQRLNDEMENDNLADRVAEKVLARLKEEASEADDGESDDDDDDSDDSDEGDNDSSRSESNGDGNNSEEKKKSKKQVRPKSGHRFFQ